MSREGSLMRLQLRYWLQLQSAEGLAGAGDFFIRWLIHGFGQEKEASILCYINLFEGPLEYSLFSLAKPNTVSNRESFILVSLRMNGTKKKEQERICDAFYDYYYDIGTSVLFHLLESSH